MTTQIADLVRDINTIPEKTNFSVFLMHLLMFARAQELLQRIPGKNTFENDAMEKQKAIIKIARMKLDTWLKGFNLHFDPRFPTDEVYLYLGHLLLHVSGGNIREARFQLSQELDAFLLK